MQLPLCEGRKVLRNLCVMGKYRLFPVARWQMVRERKVKLCRREEKRKRAERRRGDGKEEKRAQGGKGKWSQRASRYGLIIADGRQHTQPLVLGHGWHGTARPGWRICSGSLLLSSCAPFKTLLPQLALPQRR